MKKKNILTIVLVLVILLLGGASYYIATQLVNKQSVAPTAPTSEPLADETTEPVFIGSTACTLLATASAGVCTPSGVITCTPDCPTTCGTAASTITTCKNSCGAAATKDCEATDACEQAVLDGIKTAYKNETANTVGRYTLTTEIETVAKSQIYVYSIELSNISEATATGITIKDPLVDVPEVTFMDTIAGCAWNAQDEFIKCNTTIKPDEIKTFSFRVKAGDGIINGDVIHNKAYVTYDGGEELVLVKDLPISTVVGCNHTCTTDEECSTGLVCDTTTNKCRKDACLTKDSCTCTVVVTSTPRVTATGTTTPRVTAAPTEEVIAEATPTILPETGIFDLPGIAAFGGGLILAVVGILLAL